MERSVFEIVKAPLGWSVFADNVKIGGVYEFARRRPGSRRIGRILHVTDGGGVQIIVPGAEEEKPRWGVAFEIAAAILPDERAGAERRAAHGKARVKAIARL